MWRERITSLFPDAAFSAPATQAEIGRIEESFALSVPPELKGLLLESDGIAAHHGTAMVWSTREIVAQNQLFRTDPGFPELYMPFDSLFFFGDNGGGDQFAYRVLAGRIREAGVYVWNHESDNREWFANNLEDYFRRSVPTE